MRILILGGGGREHALAWRIAQSPQLQALFCAPGNPGTAQLAQNLALVAEDPAQVVAAAREHRIDLVVVGPEGPLVAGVADALEQAGVAVFGPPAKAARIEGSKAYAKEIMAAAKIPTAGYEVFEDAGRAMARARELGKVVVKADGLAAGKGVVVAHSAEEAVEAVRELAATPAGSRLVLEELLEGEEVSMIALCDGERYRLLPAARDHKRVGEGDVGPNTGGMGAFAPVPQLGLQAQEALGREVIAPTLAELRRRGSPFRGALYAGLMLTAQGPKVLEFNCRFGDPETQPLMMVLDEDLLPVLLACARGSLEQSGPLRARGAAVGVVLAAHGYPQAPRSGDEISGLQSLPPNVVAFHAGTRLEGGRLLTSGGRVLTLCAAAEDLPQAALAVYGAARAISFDGMHYRGDIARRGG